MTTKSTAPAVPSKSAAEIREEAQRIDHDTTWSASFLAEIAAQLAELNQTLRDIHPELKLPTECREHTCDYYTGYLAYGEPEMSHEAYHAMVKQAEPHFRVCDYNGPNSGGCPTCLRYEKRLRA
jgi:hypothetical protein